MTFQRFMRPVQAGEQSRGNDDLMIRITIDVPDDDHAQKIVEMIRDLQGIPASVAPDGEVIVYPVALVEIDRRRRSPRVRL